MFKIGDKFKIEVELVGRDSGMSLTTETGHEWWIDGEDLKYEVEKADKEFVKKQLNVKSKNYKINWRN